ncbi:MAG TPA: hypothetical protein VHQ91_04155, partial [Geminicoccaceae bacterium]|nr:hypothetical protein [Geminicoccaceae bacterium]
MTGPAPNERLIPRAALACSSDIAAPRAWGQAGLPNMAINWQEAAGTLAEEKSFAEEDARLLKTEAAGNRAALLRGQQLYAEAKAASDGLIARLLAVLAEDRDPAGADDLKQAADRAFVSRLA